MEESPAKHLLKDKSGYEPTNELENATGNNLILPGQGHQGKHHTGLLDLFKGDFSNQIKRQINYLSSIFHQIKCQIKYLSLILNQIKVRIKYQSSHFHQIKGWIELIELFVFNKFLADPWTIKHLIWLDIDCCPHLAGLFAPFTCSKADFKTKSNFKSISWHQISIKSNIKSNSLMSPGLFLISIFWSNSDKKWKNWHSKDEFQSFERVYQSRWRRRCIIIQLKVPHLFFFSEAHAKFKIVAFLLLTVSPWRLHEI